LKGGKFGAPAKTKFLWGEKPPFYLKGRRAGKDIKRGGVGRKNQR
jgi:hypothetical protein